MNDEPTHEPRPLITRVVGALSTGFRWIIKSELPEDQETIPHSKLRFWIALGIVLAAVSVTAAAWRAEIFMEYAAQKEALFRQDLTGQQLTERQDEEAVTSGLRQFSSYEQDVLLANALQQRAGAVHSPSLAAQAQNERALASFTVVTDPALANVVAGQAKQEVLSDPAGGYATEVLNDLILATFDPTDRHAEAQRARADAVKTAGIGVLFAIAVVLLTLSEIQLRRESVPVTETPRLGYGLAGSAAFLWFAGLVLLLMLLISEVPGLR